MGKVRDYLNDEINFLEQYGLKKVSAWADDDGNFSLLEREMYTKWTHYYDKLIKHLAKVPQMTFPDFKQAMAGQNAALTLLTKELDKKIGETSDRDLKAQLGTLRELLEIERKTNERLAEGADQDW